MVLICLYVLCRNFRFSESPFHGVLTRVLEDHRCEFGFCLKEEFCPYHHHEIYQ